MMTRVRMRDISPGGHELSSRTVDGLPDRSTLRDILGARIREEVATYNADPGPIYVGLVQPEDAVRYSEGFRMRSPRALDADHLLTAVEEAVAAGVVAFRIGDRGGASLDEEIDLRTVEEITTVMQRPIVARAP